MVWFGFLDQKAGGGNRLEVDGSGVHLLLGTWIASMEQLSKISACMHFALGKFKHQDLGSAGDDRRAVPRQS